MCIRDSVGALLDAWQSLRALGPSRAATRAHALRFAWASTSQRQLDLFRSAR